MVFSDHPLYDVGMFWRLSNAAIERLLMRYRSVFDPQEVVRRHASTAVQAQPGRLTNFLGVTMDPTYLGSILEGRSGTVEGLPIPGNWHACLAEWAGCLRALDLARGRFTVIELGCGWGCWLNNMGVAARRAGLDYELIGVEGDPGHIAFARDTLHKNGIAADRVMLHRGIAAPGAGVALFPVQKNGGLEWGLEPIFNATREQRAAAVETGSHEELPMVPLEDLIGRRERIDLLHVDIQGGEGDFIEASLRLLREKVAYIMIGTHSRGLERRIRRSLSRDGWLLEIERPAIYRMRITGPRLKVDGVQGWRNTRLLPV